MPPKTNIFTMYVLTLSLEAVCRYYKTDLRNELNKLQFSFLVYCKTCHLEHANFDLSCSKLLF